MGLKFGKLSQFLKRGLRASCKSQPRDEGQETRGLALLPLLQESRIHEPLLPFPGPSLQKHFGFLERKTFPKYRELCWKVPLCIIIWRMSAVFEGEPLLCQSQGRGQKQQRGFSEPHTQTHKHTCLTHTPTLTHRPRQTERST